MPEVSVIVPVHKVEEYLCDCVDSILAQSFNDFELILVDDGSPDNCSIICDEYAEKDNRIVVIHQKNGGLSAARNAGIDISKGKYITFIDSDDLVSNTYLDTLYRGIIDNECDISVCQYVLFKNRNEIIDNDFHKENIEIKHSKEAVIDLYNGLISVSACMKLYKSELFSEIRFPKGKLHEDQAVVPLLMYNSSYIFITDSKLYFYRSRNDSIMHGFSINRYDDLIAIDSCISFFQNKNEYDIVDAAKKSKKTIMSCYSFEAKKQRIYDLVPREYRINEFKAIYHLIKALPSEKFMYHLAIIHPYWAIVYEYIIKIKKVLGIKRKHVPS